MIEILFVSFLGRRGGMAKAGPFNGQNRFRVRVTKQFHNLCVKKLAGDHNDLW
jgi:hypothetical protein